MFSLYLWVKAFHVIAVIAWMAGMFYLPRLFVYHVETGQTGPQHETFKTMERRLLRFIINPAMITVWLLGILMIVLNQGLLSEGWLHAKLLFVLLLSGFHGACGKWRKELEAGTCTKSSKFFRIANEVPTILVILIVIMVIVRPF
jgi:protoporphyrinogen IX oxidase